MAEMRVPLLDVKAQYATVREPLLRAVETVLSGGQWILGPAVRDLEERLAAYLGVPHAIGVASGTDALLVALRALHCGPGDEVIIPTYTFFASGGAVSNGGARPVFVDIDPETFNIDPTQVEAAITSRTSAILPVHLYGLPCDMPRLMAIAARHPLAVIEDACQAHGARIDGRRAASLGTGRFPFFSPNKHTPPRGGDV